MNYTLSADQKAAWAEAMKPFFPQGMGAKAAEAIAKADGTAVSSWKSRLSNFKRGDEAELRAVFEEEARLDALAKALERSPEELRGILARVQGALVEDGPDICRIPGFESYGPVSAERAYHPLPRREARILPTPPPEGYPAVPTGHSGGTLEVKDLLALAQVRVTGGQAILIGGVHGMGKLLILQALAAAYEAAGGAAEWWAEGRRPEAQILLVDGLDRMEPPHRKEIARLVSEGQLSLVATVSNSEPWADLPRHRSVFIVGYGDPSWSRAYLQHLAAIGESEWAQSFDFGPLVRWMESDPFAASLFQRRDILGLLARACVEWSEDIQGAFQPSQDLLPELAVQRAATRLRLRGRRVESSFISLCGLPFLAEVAQILCENGRQALGLAEAAGALMHAASAYTPPSLAAKGGSSREGEDRTVFPYLEALVDVGLLHPRGDELRVTLPLIAPALGLRLDPGALDRASLWESVVLEPLWHPAIVAAATGRGDSAPWMQALLSAPPEWAPRSIQALTRLLSEPIPCGDPDTLRRAFLLCAWWWCVWPLKPDSFTMTLSLSVHIPPPPSFEPGDRVGGLSPLLVLARASYIHREHLPSTLEAVDSPEALGCAPELGELLRVLVGADRRRPDPSSFLFAAPSQSPLLFEPWVWRWIGEIYEGDGKDRLGLTYEDMATWWASAAAPCLMRQSEGRVLVGGGAGAGIGIFMRLSRRGSTGFWSEAVKELIEAGHPQTPLILAGAFACVVEMGGAYNEEALEALWDMNIPHQGRVQDAIALRLAWGERPFNREDRPWLRWLLKKVLRTTRLEGVWRRWADLLGDDVPWRVFLEVGLAPEVLGAWAVGRLGELDPKRDLHLRFGTVKLTPSEEIVKAVLETGNLDGILSIFTGRAGYWRERAVVTLARLETPEGRGMRMWLAAVFPDDRPTLLKGLWPTMDEETHWEEIVDSSGSWGEWTIRCLQWSQVEPETLGEMWEDVNHLLLELLEPEEGDDPVEFGEVDGLVLQICTWVAKGNPAPDGAVEAFLSSLEQHTEVVNRLQGEAMGVFWVVYLSQRGVERTIALLTSLHPMGSEKVVTVAPPLAVAFQGTITVKNHQPRQTLPHPTFARLHAVVGHRLGLELHRSALRAPTLAPYAARTLVERLLPARWDVFLEELERRELREGRAQWQEQTRSLLFLGLFNRQPEAALEFLDGGRETLGRESLQRYWGEAARRLLGTELGPRAVRGYLNARRDGDL